MHQDVKLCHLTLSRVEELLVFFDLSLIYLDTVTNTSTRILSLPKQKNNSSSLHNHTIGSIIRQFLYEILSNFICIFLWGWEQKKYKNIYNLFPMIVYKDIT